MPSRSHHGRSAADFPRTRLRIGEELTRHVIACLRNAGMDAVRGFVDAHNKAALLMYQRLGAQFLPCRVGGRSMVQVSFNLSGHDHCVLLGEVNAMIAAVEHRDGCHRSAAEH